MKCLRVQNGDLFIEPSRHASLVDRHEKLLQDLTLWLLEPLGTGYLTPGFGSVLWGFIGTTETIGKETEIKSEVERILSLYQTNQIEQIKAAWDRGTAKNYSKAELLDLIESVEVVTTFESESASMVGLVVVKATLKTMSGDRVVLPLQETNEGLVA